MADESNAGVLQFLVELRDKFSGPLNEIKEHAEGFKESVGRIGKAAAAAFVGYEVLEHVIGPAEEMQQAQVRLAQATGATADQLKEAQEQADSLSTTYARSAEDITAAQTAMSKYTGSLDAAKETMATTAQFANVIGTSAEGASKILGPAMETMGDQAKPVAERMQDVADKITAMVKAMPNVGGAQQMARELANTAGTAKQLGLNIDQSLAAVETLSKSGAARNAGVSFGTLAEAMLKAGKDGVPAIREAGFALYHFRDGTIDLTTTIEHLHDRGPAALEAFEKKLGPSGRLLALMVDHVGDITKGTQDLANAAGSTAAEAAKQQETLAAQLANLHNAVTDLAVAFGTPLLAPIADFAHGLTDVLGAVRQFAEEHPHITEFASAIAGLASGAIALGGAFYIVHSSLVAVKAGMMAVKVAMTANPIGLLVTAIAVAAFEIYEHWDKIKQWFAEGVAWCREHIEGIRTALAIMTGGISEAAIAIYNHWEDIKRYFSEAVDWIRNHMAIVAAIAGPFGWLVDAAVLVYDHWQDIKRYFAEAATAIVGAWQPVSDFFKTMWDAVVGVFQAAWDKIRPVIEDVRQAAEWMDNKVKAISEAAKSVKSAVSGAASSADGAVTGAARSVLPTWAGGTPAASPAPVSATVNNSVSAPANITINQTVTGATAPQAAAAAVADVHRSLMQRLNPTSADEDARLNFGDSRFSPAY